MAAAQAFLIADYGPVAQFTATPLAGATKPLSVTFNDQSTGVTSRFWDFGDGTNSTAGNPTHTYTVNNTYTVRLTVTGPGGTDYMEKAAYIQVGPPLQIVNGQTKMPTDPDGDGLYEDLNGNLVIDYNDLQIYFLQMNWLSANEPIRPFDYNKNSNIDYNDLQLLFKKMK